MAGGPLWTIEEKLRLLACVDYCRQYDLDFENTLPGMLARQGFTHTWRRITSCLRILARGKGKTLTSFRAQGSAFAPLSAQHRTELSTYASAATASVSKSGSNPPAPSSSTVADTDKAERDSEVLAQRQQTTESPINRGTKRRRAPDENVPYKRRRTTKPADLSDQISVQAGDDSIHGAEESHQMEGIEQEGGQEETVTDRQTVERRSESQLTEREAVYEEDERNKISKAREVRETRVSQEREPIRATSTTGVVTHPGSSDSTSQQSPGQLEDLYSQLRSVITDLRTQVNTSLRVTYLEKELDTATHKQALAESKQLESEQRATDAEAQLQEVKKRMRQRFREFETKEEQYRIRASNESSENREKLEIGKRNTQYVEEEAKRTIKNLEEKSQAKIKHIEETTKHMGDYYREKIDDETQRNERLHHRLQVLCGDKLVGRYHDTKFPIEYSVAELHAFWANSVPNLADIIDTEYDMTAERTFREDTSIPRFQSLLRLIVGQPLTPGSDTDDLSISDCFQHLSNEPTDYYLAVAFFMARAVQWCFNTSWHIDEPECSKMQEVWESIATDGGPKAVREQDMLATLRKVTNDQYRDYEVPIMAKCQMAIFKKEFSRHLNLKNEMMYQKLERCLGKIMIMKLELLICNSHNKVAFVPPGTPYDPAWMTQTGEDTNADIVKKDKEYRVRLCLSPALIKDVPEPVWQDGNPPGDSEKQDFRDALLQSRNFFPEETGQWKGWPNSRVASKAQVILEEVPRSAESAT